MPQHHMLHTSAALWGIAQTRTTRSEMLCKYHGRTCLHPRATKLNGELHRFCNHHRLRHNVFQRAYQERRDRKAVRLKQCSDGRYPSYGMNGLELITDDWSAIPFELDELFVDAGSNAVKLTRPAHVSLLDTAIAATDHEFQLVAELVQPLDNPSAL